MKKIIGLVLVIGLLSLGSFFGVGFLTERTIKKDIDYLNQVDGLQVDLQDYQRGFFHSTAELHWTIHIPERVVKKDGQATVAPAQDYSVDTPMLITHGPVIIIPQAVKLGMSYASATMKLPKNMDDMLAQMITAESVKPQFHLTIFTNFLNRSHVQMAVPDFKLMLQNEGGEFHWLGLSTRFVLYSDLSRISGNIDFNGVLFQRDQKHINLGKIASQYDLSRRSGLYLGEANLSFESLVFLEDKDVLFALDQFKLSSESDVNGGLFHSSLKTALAKVIAEGVTYGPAVLNLDLTNLDADALGRIHEKTSQMQQGSDEERQQALAEIFPELLTLLSKGPVVEISEVSFVLPEGRISSNVRVSLPEGKLDNPFQLIQKLQGKGMLKVPAEVVKNLLFSSAKKAIEQPGLQHALIKEMHDQNAASIDENAVDQESVEPPVGSVSSSDTSTLATAPAEELDMEQLARQQVDIKLQDLVQSGLITVSGDDYVVEFALSEGQFTINGKPFTPDMVNF